MDVLPVSSRLASRSPPARRWRSELQRRRLPRSPPHFRLPELHRSTRASGGSGGSRRPVWTWGERGDLFSLLGASCFGHFLQGVARDARRPLSANGSQPTVVPQVRPRTALVAGRSGDAGPSSGRRSASTCDRARPPWSQPHAFLGGVRAQSPDFCSVPASIPAAVARVRSSGVGQRWAYVARVMVVLLRLSACCNGHHVEVCSA